MLVQRNSNNSIKIAYYRINPWICQRRKETFSSFPLYYEKPNFVRNGGNWSGVKTEIQSVSQIRTSLTICLLLVHGWFFKAPQLPRKYSTYFISVNP